VDDHTRTEDSAVPKYMFIGNYTAQGAHGVLSDGGTRRRQAAEEVVGSVGGRIESMYFAFGGEDVYIIADLPDNKSAAAASVVVNSAGGIALRTVVLLSAEELDGASKMSVNYSPPGKS